MKVKINLSTNYSRTMKSYVFDFMLFVACCACCVGFARGLYYDTTSLPWGLGAVGFFLAKTFYGVLVRRELVVVSLMEYIEEKIITTAKESEISCEIIRMAEDAVVNNNTQKIKHILDKYGRANGKA